MIHELKTWPEYFEAVLTKNKNFEYRKNDRDFKVGDKLVLKEWDVPKEEYTGREVKVYVSYVLKDQMGVAEGYVILSIKHYEPCCGRCIHIHKNIEKEPCCYCQHSTIDYFEPKPEYR